MVKTIFKFVKQDGIHKVITITRKNDNNYAFNKLANALEKIHADGKKSNLCFDANTHKFLFCYLLDGYEKYDLIPHEFYEAEFKTKVGKNEEYVNFTIVGSPTPITVKNEYIGGYLSN